MILTERMTESEKNYAVGRIGEILSELLSEIHNADIVVKYEKRNGADGTEGKALTSRERLET